MSPERRQAIEADVRRAVEDGDRDRATEIAVRGHGPEVFGFLLHCCDDESLASDAFSWFCESLLTALPRFRWEASLRSLCYLLARRGISRALRDRPDTREGPLTTGRLQNLAQSVTTSALPLHRQQVGEGVAALRAALPENDRVLLTLRVDRELPWREIAIVLADDEGPMEAPELRRRTAALRKQYERAKARLHDLAKARGLGR